MLNYDEEAAGPSPSHLLSAGRIQLRLWYDADSAQLTVSLLCAFGLMPLMDDQLANAFVLLCLLPFIDDKRRSKTVHLNNEPSWNQLFTFAPLMQADLPLSSLQLEVMDYQNNISGPDLIGETVIPLSSCDLNDSPVWYELSSERRPVTPTLV
uniref:C2 domain-containing protein n=1 Tax=Macrostomum lignano TaxID=282301 RepID=A0A1I8I8A9_9PLAT